MTLVADWLIKNVPLGALATSSRSIGADFGTSRQFFCLKTLGFDGLHYEPFQHSLLSLMYYGPNGLCSTLSLFLLICEDVSKEPPCMLGAYFEDCVATCLILSSLD